MKAFGIEFTHRRPGPEPYVARDFAEFTAFAAACDVLGVARFVDGVFFDTKSQTFDLDVADKHESTPVGAAIQYCARKTLTQYILFGTYWCREPEGE